MNGQLYPRNREGIIDEWIAIELQKQRATEDHIKHEKDNEQIVKNLYQ